MSQVKLNSCALQFKSQFMTHMPTLSHLSNLQCTRCGGHLQAKYRRSNLSESGDGTVGLNAQHDQSRNDGGANHH